MDFFNAYGAYIKVGKSIEPHTTGSRDLAKLSRIRGDRHAARFADKRSRGHWLGKAWPYRLPIMQHEKTEMKMRNARQEPIKAVFLSAAEAEMYTLVAYLEIIEGAVHAGS